MAEYKLDKSHIKEIYSRYVGIDGAALQHNERTRIQDFERMIWNICRNYDMYYDIKTARGQDSPFQRSASYEFLEAISRVHQEKKFQLSSRIECRIMQSDYLALVYAIIGGGIDYAIERYINSLSPEQKSEYETDESKVIDLIAEVAERFIHEQRKKSKENDLAKLFPYAPTTGFEYEYLDSIRRVIDRLQRIPNETKILLAIRNKDVDFISGLEGTNASRRDKEFISQTIKRVKSLEHKFSMDEIIDGLIYITNDELARLMQWIAVWEEITGNNSERGARLRIKEQLKNATLESKEQIERVVADPQILANLTEWLQRRLDFIEGKFEYEAGQQPSIEDLTTIKMLVQSPALRLSSIGAFKAVDELQAAEEVITSPSVSVRLQLRDFVYAAKLGAFSENISVHQTIGVVELSPNNSDFMEVTAILEAAGWNATDEEITEDAVNSIMMGHHVYYDPYRKLSHYSDGKFYYFPYHRFKKEEEAEQYPQESTSLVELRAERAFRLNDSFITHVRASTFTWLAAWGKQAADIPENQRTVQQKDLALAWENLLSGWSLLLRNKGIYQPRGTERYQEAFVVDNKAVLLGEEKYSLYLEKIFVMRNSESRDENVQYNKSLRFGARKLIREYNHLVKAIIGYK